MKPYVILTVLVLVCMLAITTITNRAAASEAPTVHRELIDERINSVELERENQRLRMDNAGLRQALWAVAQRGWGQCS